MDDQTSSSKMEVETQQTNSSAAGANALRIPFDLDMWCDQQYCKSTLSDEIRVHE